jgi:hypothetical protein
VVGSDTVSSEEEEAGEVTGDACDEYGVLNRIESPASKRPESYFRAGSELESLRRSWGPPVAVSIKVPSFKKHGGAEIPNTPELLLPVSELPHVSVWWSVLAALLLFRG